MLLRLSLLVYSLGLLGWASSAYVPYAVRRADVQSSMNREAVALASSALDQVLDLVNITTQYEKISHQLQQQTNIVNKLADKLNHVQEEVKKCQGDVVATVSECASCLVRQCSFTSTCPSSNVEDIVREYIQIKEEYTRQLQQIKNFENKFDESEKERLVGLINSVHKEVNQYSEVFLQVLSKLSSTTFQQDMKQHFTNKFNTSAADVKTIFDGLIILSAMGEHELDKSDFASGKSVQEAVESLVEAMKNQSTILRDENFGHIDIGRNDEKSKLELIWKEVKESLNDAWDVTKKVSTTSWDFTKDVSSDSWDFTKDVSSESWDFTKDVSSDSWDATKDFSKDAFQTTKDVSCKVASIFGGCRNRRSAEITTPDKSICNAEQYKKLNTEVLICASEPDFDCESCNLVAENNFSCADDVIENLKSYSDLQLEFWTQEEKFTKFMQSAEKDMQGLQKEAQANFNNNLWILEYAKLLEESTQPINIQQIYYDPDQFATKGGKVLYDNVKVLVKSSLGDDFMEFSLPPVDIHNSTQAGMVAAKVFINKFKNHQSIQNEIISFLDGGKDI